MDNSFYTKYFEVEKNHWWFKGRRTLVFNLLQKYLVGGSKVFDFGCGSGFLVRELGKRGYDSYGGDFSETALKQGEKLGISNISKISNNITTHNDDTFDCVLVLDVMEHLKNDREGIEEIERILKPGGFCIITVPAFNFLWGIQDEVYHHYRRYTKNSLKKTLSMTSLKISGLTYFNFILFPFVAIVRLLSKIIKPSRRSDFEINNQIINKLLSYIFRIDISIAQKMSVPFGVSLLAITIKETDVK